MAGGDWAAKNGVWFSLRVLAGGAQLFSFFFFRFHFKQIYIFKPLSIKVYIFIQNFVPLMFHATLLKVTCVIHHFKLDAKSYCATILTQVISGSFEKVNEKTLYFFIYDDLFRLNLITQCKNLLANSQSDNLVRQISIPPSRLYINCVLA